MRTILNLSMFVFMWLSLISASSQDLDTVGCVLTLDLKLVCDGEHIRCVCNHGSENYTGFYSLKLDFSELNQTDTFFRSISDGLIEPLIEQFQMTGVLNHKREYTCPSIRLIKKDSTHVEGWDSDAECETLLHSPIAAIHDRFNSVKDLALEVNLEPREIREPWHLERNFYPKY